MTALLLSAIRITALLGFTLALLPLLRRQSAAVRCWLLATALAGAALVPALQLVAPSWGRPLEVAAGLPSTAPVSVVLAIWAAGAAVHLFVLLLGVVRLMGVAAAADPIREGLWADLALDIAAEYRLHAPVLLLEADRPTLPVTWGYRQPKVLLPPAARDWSEERTRIVLRHELAHIRRRDWLLHLLATVVRSVYWFHPLVWITCAALRLESERACDDAVLRSGVSGDRYASHLLALARGFLEQRRRPVIAPGFARRTTLERRVRAMLAASADRSATRRTGSAAIALVMLTLATALAGFGAQTVEAEQPAVTAPPRRLTLLLDGQIVDLSKGWPTYPNPRAGLVTGPGVPPETRLR